MDFMTVGSINSYVKNMSMESKWQSRKNTGNYAADGAKTISDWMEKQKKKTEEKTSVFDHLKNNNSDSKLTAINNKLSKGAKLTPAEKEYLRKKDAAAYKRVQNIEAEEKEFENKLRQCKTKDEVRRLKLNYASASLAAVNSIKDSPYISDADKRAFMSEQQQKLAAIDRVHTDFVKSGEFSDLPTDAERAEAAKKLAEAENGNEENNTDNIENKNDTEKVADNSSNSKDVAAEREPKKVKVVNHDKEGKAKVEEKEAPKARRSEGARKMAAKAKAEQSYEVRKTRRSRKAFRTAAVGGNIAAVGGNAKSAASVKQAVSVTPRAIGSSLDVKA